MIEEEIKDGHKFHSIDTVYVPNVITVISKLILAVIAFMFILLSITPWQQTSMGNGKIVAYNPNDRVQNINTTVPGIVSKWFVREGSQVKKGDSIVEIIDNDPQFIERLKIERDAILKKYEAAKAASETALLNFDRQKELFEQGLSARTKFEKAKIEYKKLLAGEATAAANLAKAEVKFARQQTQLVQAPRDGTISRVLHGTGSIFVKEGDILATFVPKTAKPAAEIYVNGNDLPLVYPGRKVRLQFEGWPAVQFSGWPSVAIGTFGGEVTFVDPTATKNGKFRVLIKPEDGEIWPDNKFLRQGTRVYGWVLLNNVKLGYEIWRQFNGFPASMDAPPEDIVNSKKDKKKKKKDKDYKDVYK